MKMSVANPSAACGAAIAREMAVLSSATHEIGLALLYNIPRAIEILRQHRFFPILPEVALLLRTVPEFLQFVHEELAAIQRPGRIIPSTFWIENSIARILVILQVCEPIWVPISLYTSAHGGICGGICGGPIAARLICEYTARAIVANQYAPLSTSLFAAGGATVVTTCEPICAEQLRGEHAFFAPADGKLQAHISLAFLAQVLAPR